jgi:hypothetical protein
MNPIFKKLNFKEQPFIVVLNAPDSFRSDMEEMKTFTKVKTATGEKADIPFFLAFVTRQNQLDEMATAIVPLLKDDAVLWFAYPKAASKKYTCEFNRDNGWHVLGDLGFEGVRMVAIDQDWSALRFRRAENIKKMTRRFAMSDKGKQRTGVTDAKKTKRAG